MKTISKLKFKKIDINRNDILQKRELKHILGGYGSGGGWGCVPVTCNGETFYACGDSSDIQCAIYLKCGVGSC